MAHKRNVGLAGTLSNLWPSKHFTCSTVCSVSLLYNLKLIALISRRTYLGFDHFLLLLKKLVLNMLPVFLSGSFSRSQRTFLIMSNRSPTHKAAIEPWCVWLVGKSVCAGDTLSWHTMGSGLHGNLAAVYFRFIPSPVITQCGSVAANSALDPRYCECVTDYQLWLQTLSSLMFRDSCWDQVYTLMWWQQHSALLEPCNVNTRHVDYV